MITSAAVMHALTQPRIEAWLPGSDDFVVEMLASWYYGGGVHWHTNDQSAL